jgi:neutral ceramidase
VVERECGMAWQAAVGRVDITPPVDTPMGGYGTPLDGVTRRAVGTRNPLWARAVALWDSGRPHVLLCTDVLGWATDAATQVRQRLAGATGIPESQLILTSTHNHNGPALPGVGDPWLEYGLTDTTALGDYEEFLVDVVIGLVLDLLGGDRIPATVDYQVTAASFSANREDLPYTETDVPVLVARHLDGSPLAVVFGYGCHPVCSGGQNLWDGDYPAAAAAVIDAALPEGMGVFLPGPAGDQDPVGERGWQLTTDIGAELGAAVLSAAATPGRELTGVKAARLGTASLPLDVTISPGNLTAAADDYAERVRRAIAPGWVLRHAERMVDVLASGQAIATAVDLPVQVWRLAGAPDLRLAFVGGELVSGYAVYLRQHCDGADGLWIGGYGPGSVGYLPSDELLPPLRLGGSYAGGWDPDFPGLAGGSACAYGLPAHFLAGGIEPAVVDALVELMG